ENEDQVQAQLSPMSSTLLKPGVKNKAVVQLKKDLKKLGYGNFPANPSNVYGTVTANVVKDFQRANGLAVDGIAGSATLNLIESLLNSNLTTAQVIQLKKDLRALGFGSFPSNPSSVYGNVTKKVVKEFQAYAKLKQTGVADTQTLKKIKQVLNPPYRNGDQGVAITKLKKDLRKLGYGNFPASPSNVYGTVTANVVKSFQRDNGLAADGIAGKDTLNQIESLLTFNLSSSQIIQLKKDLRALGFGNFPANPSGVYGNVTKKVVKEFQAYAKLKQTGVADTQTLNKIKQVLNPPYRNGDQGVAVTKLKKDLRKLSYGNFPANPSNVYGTVTANVVKDFQRANGLTADGVAGQKTLDTIDNLLTFNMTEKEVIQLKKDLRALGFGNFPKNPTGVYGDVTKRVVKQFQAYAKLEQTGMADSKTLNKIKQVLNPPYRNGDQGEAVTKLKKDLRKLGYGNFPANPSNVYGTVTANVVKSFQRANGLTADGIAGKDTLNKIKSLLAKPSLSGKKIKIYIDAI